MSVKIRVREAVDDKVGPIVTTFVQGPPAEECLTGQEKTGPFQPIDFRLKGSSDSRKRTHRQLTGINDSLRFEAKNYGEEVQKSAAKYMLGVYNPKRQRVDVYPLEGQSVLGLQLTNVNGSSSASSAASASGGLEGMGMRERRDLVVADFGSKKKMKMEASKKANIVDITAVAAAKDIEGSLRDKSKQLAAQAQAAQGSSAMDTDSSSAAPVAGQSKAKTDEALMRGRLETLPPFDLKATSVSRVYPLTKLLHGDIYRSLSAAAYSLMKGVAEADDPDSEVNKKAAEAAEEAEAAAADSRPPRSPLDQAIWRFCGRDSEYLKDRVKRLLPKIREANQEEKEAKEQEEEEAEEEAEEEEEEADEDASDSERRKKKKSGKTPRRKGFKRGASGDETPVFKKLCCLAFIKFLLALLRAPGYELKYKRMTLPAPGAAKPAKGSGSSAAAKPADEEEAEGLSGADGAAATTVTRVCVPQLKFLPDSVVAYLLATFTEARADDSAAGRMGAPSTGGMAGAALAAAMGREPRSSSSSSAASDEAPIPAFVYARTPALNDKAKSYIAVLSLFVDDFTSVDIKLLCSDLKLVPAKLATVYREAGCVTIPVKTGGVLAKDGEDDEDEEKAAGGSGSGSSSSSGKKVKGGVVETYLATLKAPLQFPNLKLGRAK